VNFIGIEKSRRVVMQNGRTVNPKCVQSLARHNVIWKANIILGLVVVQRYRKEDLSVERKKRLDRIGFVWSWRDFAWQRGFAALLKFKRREGHCRVSRQHREDNYRLGDWVAVQRSKRDALSPQRRRRLDNIGFEWKVYKT
jgi:hypothetical protein